MKGNLFLLLILFLSSCALQAPVQPVAPPSPDLPTEQPAADALPENQPTPTIPLLLDSPVPTSPASSLLPLPEISDQPENPALISETAEIAILRPGQLSRVASPFQVSAYLNNPGDDRATITLFGEDGRELASLVKKTLLYGNEINGNIILDLEFEIEALAEAGRLEIKVFDGYGRLRAVNTVSLVLLSMGETDRNYSLEDKERIELQIPFPTTTEIVSSPLLISGLVRLTPPPEAGDPEPLIVQLVNQAGTVVGEGRAPVVLTLGSAYGQFVAEIPYQVDTPTPVLLTISIQEGRVRGLTYLKSYPLTLNP